MKLLIATTNPAKQAELTAGVMEHAPHVEILTLDDFPEAPEPEETGETFLENAQIKAEYYGDLFGVPTLADDGGFAIDILGGEPGVKAKRWLGRPALEVELATHAIERLVGKPKNERTAVLETCLFFYDPNTGKSFSTQEKVLGWVAEELPEEITPGFPYRAIFYVSEFDKRYDDLTPAEHAKVNHRLLALKKLLSQIS